MNKLNAQKAGVAVAVLAYTVWGILPLYWKLLDDALASEVLAHRIIWSFVTVLILIGIKTNWGVIRQSWHHLASNRKQLLAMLGASALISGNWLTYIWAVNNDKVIETSLGYYINPLFSVLLGVIVLKERLSFFQKVAFILAGGGVLLSTLHYGALPWVSLVLATTFAFYGLAKKVLNLDTLSGLFFETLFALPVALSFAIGVSLMGKGGFGIQNPTLSLLMAGTGVVTALPLLWFAYAAKRIPLSTLGFIQYIAPSINLFLGIFIFKEPFTWWNFSSFLLIWIALALYSLSTAPWMMRWEKRMMTKRESRRYLEL